MIELKVAGMTCQHCVRAVTQAIQAEDPRAAVQVDLAAGPVRATWPYGIGSICVR